MRDYEITILLAPTLTDKELDKAVKGLTDVFEKAGAKVSKKVDTANKAMAYEIKKFHEANYAYMEVSAKPSDILGFDTKLKQDDNVIRYLIVAKNV